MHRAERIEQLAYDCVHYRADRACKVHLRTGDSCRCAAYCPRSRNVLMIQLSDPAETIRSGALVARLKADDPNCHLVYLSAFPELLSEWVDEPLGYDAGSILRCQMDTFEVVYNLDLDARACAITNLLTAETKKGFYLRQGRSLPLDEDSEAVFLERVMPGVEGRDRCHPLRQLFGLCGLSYRGERARLQMSDAAQASGDEGAMVGVNVCGEVREGAHVLWDADYWVEAIGLLSEHYLPVRLLGAPQTRAIQESIAGQTYVAEKACASWSEVQAAVSSCSVIVSGPGAVAELALALGRRLVLLVEGEASTVDESMLRGRGCTLPGAGQRGISLRDIYPNEIVAAVRKEMSQSGQAAGGKMVEEGLEAALAGRSEVARRREPPRC